MNTPSTLIPAGRRLSRAKPRSCLQTIVVIGDNFGLSRHSECPPSRSVSTSCRNPSLINVPKRRYVRNLLPRTCNDTARRYQSSDQTTATVSDNSNQDDDVHRYRYQLYKYKICPFSNMAKVFLEYNKIPFESVEVNPLTKAELEFSKSYRKVPIVTVLDSDATTPASQAFQQLNGTEEIFPHEYQLFEEEGEEFSSSESSKTWQDFAQKKLAPLLYPNICRTLGDSFKAFDYVHVGPNTFSMAQRYSIQYLGSVAMYFAASKIKEKYKIDDVQVALDEILEQLESELSNNQSKFLEASSQAPHLGDLSVFGVLKGLEGLPLWNSIFLDDSNSSRYSNIRQWYASVSGAVDSRKLQTPRYGFN